MDQPQLEITVLGSGTSTGVPVIGCKCSVCKSGNPKNNRTRSSIAIKVLTKDQTILVDTTPDLRFQALAHEIDSVHSVLLTHTHADHCHGFDDLRAFCFHGHPSIDMYMTATDCAEITERFSYAFKDTGYKGAVPQVTPQEIVPYQPFSLLGIEVDPILLPHGSAETCAFRVGNFAYATDFKMFSQSDIKRWKGKIDVMIASGLRWKMHQTHSVIKETIQLFKDLDVKRGILTHLSHDIDFPIDSQKLPEGVEFAYDGQKVFI